MTPSAGSASNSEALLPRVLGTAEWRPAEYAELAALQTLLLERFSRAGYDRIRTPILEPVDLHERKSGAGIVAKLFKLDGDEVGPVCLRPELTAGIARMFAEQGGSGPTLWRVSHAGTTFRHESATRSDRLREFRQVGVERLGDGGPAVDAELVWLASWTLAEAGVRQPQIRVGHVGLILEALSRSGLPPAARMALVEMLSEAAAEGRGVESLERGLDHFSAWLDGKTNVESLPLAVDRADDAGVDRLFQTLVPVVTGRRSGHEILHRLRRKWELGRDLGQTFDRVRHQIRELADCRGPAPEVLDRLARDHRSEAPRSLLALRRLLDALADHGVDADRVEIDLGFGRGIGFYSQMIFEVVAATPAGPIQVCGGGRYDGLVRVLGGQGVDRGAGFAFGLERLHGVLRSQGRLQAVDEPVTVWVHATGSGASGLAVRAATRLRSSGIRAVLSDGDDHTIGKGVVRVEVARDEAGLESVSTIHSASGRRRPATLETLPQQVSEEMGDLIS